VHRAHLLALALTLAAPLALAACGEDHPPVTVSESEQESGDEAREAPPAEALPVTRNTSRIGSADPAETAAEVALATHPRSQAAKPVEAVAIAPASEWQVGIAAAVLAAEPLKTPILLSQSGSVPDATEEAISALAPQGGSGPADAGAYAIGDVAVPDDVDATEVDGEGPAEIAAAIDELRGSLTGAEPDNVVVVGDDAPEYAMPAAAWAARSGDPVLFAGGDSAPAATLAALERHASAAVYVLGPPSAVSDKALREIQRAAPNAKRIGVEDPVANAIEFARFADGGFGWNINDPGHGLVVANLDRPGDAGAAAALSGSGSYGPLLLTDNATELPGALNDFLLDIKPGYEEDPTRALYNHVWVIGDETAISGEVQAKLDDAAELSKIGGVGAGVSPLPTGPKPPEDEPLPTTPGTSTNP
jgi:hypothetical protein